MANNKISAEDYDLLTGLLMIKCRVYSKMLNNKKDLNYYYQIMDLINTSIAEINENIDEMNEIIDVILELQVEIFKSINDSFELMEQKNLKNEEI
ncbi:hypothetical protein Q2T46_10765 [Thermoanaerobacterium sp. CMT5567-10]|uniref:hypothetical protein n=1 Tax=Thermoanaerobacterium sp. CMT5567-10 TaxID=3061989 RepID=UPI0026DEB0E9|nr:hypothetical protein [Thermoanaerobacterium sp. CMT5567-10]WKV08024.1 hypothetical protein Q2T46_10765 [Thermoanaerobacterium sp. CMT5567-10]